MWHRIFYIWSNLYLRGVVHSSGDRRIRTNPVVGCVEPPLVLARQAFVPQGKRVATRVWKVRASFLVRRFRVDTKNTANTKSTMGATHIDTRCVFVPNTLFHAEKWYVCCFSRRCVPRMRCLLWTYIFALAVCEHMRRTATRLSKLHSCNKPAPRNTRIYTQTTRMLFLLKAKFWLRSERFTR